MEYTSKSFMHDGNIPVPEKKIIENVIERYHKFIYCFNDAGILSIDQSRIIYFRFFTNEGEYITSFMDYMERLIAIHDTYKLYTLHHGVFVSDVYYCLNHFGFTDPISDNCYELI